MVHTTPCKCAKAITEFETLADITIKEIIQNNTCKNCSELFQTFQNIRTHCQITEPLLSIGENIIQAQGTKNPDNITKAKIDLTIALNNCAGRE